MARVPLSTIKTSLQDILEDANTTTGSPIDLSDSLTDRVREVLQINVERLPIQPSFYPCITMFYDKKDVELLDMAANMLNGRRRAEIDLKIVGFVWIDNMNASNYNLKDLADNEIEQLMENIEQVLRSDPTLQGNVTWSKTVDVQYHTYPISEDAHMRAGEMTHRISVIY
jgi:hypothetical protein